MGRRHPHVVMISGTAPPQLDGVGDTTAMLLRELTRQRPRWRWSWLTRRPRFLSAPLGNVAGATLHRPIHSWTPRGIRLAAGYLRRLRPDLVHIQDQTHAFWQSDAPIRLAEATEAPAATTLHEYHDELASVKHTSALVRRSRFVVANDLRNARRCREQAGREPDAVWWSGSAVPPPEPSWGLEPETGAVTTFGFINALKALDPPFLALDRLRDRHPELRWRIIGPFDPGSDPGHAELARRLGADWVEFTGAIPLEDQRLRTLLGRSRVMLLPYADGASLRRSTLHAAWSFGLPVVTTPPDEPEPAILDGENCLLIRESTPEAWADAIGAVLGDPALAERLRAGSRAAGKRFSWERLAARWIEAYERLLDAPPPPGGQAH